MSKSSLPRLDLLLLPFHGGDNEGGESNEGGQDEGKPAGEGGNKPEGKGGKPEDEDDEDDDDLNGITDPNQRRIAELSREAARHRREKNVAKRERDRIQAELDGLKSGKGTEKEQWEAEKAQLLAQLEELKGNTSNAVLRNAVNSPDSKYSWYDVPVVMGLINREAIEIDLEEGVVDGLEAELKRIAKEKPYLVKKGAASGSSKNTEGEGEGSGGSGTNGSTGNQPSGRLSSNDAKAAQRATLVKKYPALNVS